MSQLVTIGNGRLTAIIAAKGAEIQSLVPAGGGDVMWTGDADVWPWHAPNLFPIVGALDKNQFSPILAITDGTSNTIMIAEDAGRPQGYAAGGRSISAANGGNPGQAGWADGNGAFSIDGAQPNGAIVGTCPLNCSNNSEIYSFHTNGANVVFADGSVHFLKDSISTWPFNPATGFPTGTTDTNGYLVLATGTQYGVYQKLSTRNGGEVISSDQY